MPPLNALSIVRRRAQGKAPPGSLRANCSGVASAQLGVGVSGSPTRQAPSLRVVSGGTKMTGIGPLLLFACIATATPGAATVMAIASGVRFGVARSMPLVAGLALGVGMMAAATGSGLGTALQMVPSAELILCLVGSSYLLWLSWRVARSGAPRMREVLAPSGLVTGLILTVQNPKAWAMTLGAAASFPGLATTPAALALLFGGIFAGFVLLALSFWCVAGRAMGRWLRTERQWTVANAMLGVLLATSVIQIWWP